VKASIYAGFTAGLALFIGLIAYQGAAEVAAVLAIAGWGLVVVALFHLLPMAFNTLGWLVLFQAGKGPAFSQLLRARWIGEAINALLPVAQVGGDVVKARLIMRHGITGAIAGASVIADLTIGLFAQVIFTLMGMFLLAHYFGDGAHAWWLLTGVIISLALFASFYAVQRLGIFSRMAHALERLCSICSGGAWTGITGSAQAMDAALNNAYRRRLSVSICGMWRLLGWMAGAGEIWLALYFMGQPISPWEALLLESLGQAVRAAAFLVPGALGVQEGGFVLLGGILGISPEIALALSLVKRVRELVMGLPGLVAWQFFSGKSLWQKREQSTPSA